MADALLRDRLAKATAHDSFTILFMSTPNEPLYEAEFDEPIHVEFKRETQDLKIRLGDNETEWERLPLFEKYQFLTPGL